jgi:hypothetical protein
MTAAALERDELDHLNFVQHRWKRFTDLKERLDLIQLDDVVGLLKVTQSMERDDAVAELMRSAQHGEFGFTELRRQVKELLYLEPDTSPRGTRRLRLTPLEIETMRCIRHLYGSRPVLARWLQNRGWPVPPWLNRARRAAEERGPRAAATDAPAPKRKGPVPGTTDRVAQARRALFPTIDKLRKNSKSVTAAVDRLPDEELPGTGTIENKRLALVKTYNRARRS